MLEIGNDRLNCPGRPNSCLESCSPGITDCPLAVNFRLNSAPRHDIGPTTHLHRRNRQSTATHCVKDINLGRARSPQLGGQPHLIRQNQRGPRPKCSRIQPRHGAHNQSIESTERTPVPKPPGTPLHNGDADQPGPDHELNRGDRAPTIGLWRWVRISLRFGSNYSAQLDRE